MKPSRLTQMVNDNNNLMDGYVLQHAWDAADQTAAQSAACTSNQPRMQTATREVFAPPSVNVSLLRRSEELLSL